MNRIHARTAAVILACTVTHAAVAERRLQDAYRENRAVIVVTGMRLNENPADYRKDLSVAEGAVVRLTGPDSQRREKKTAAFRRGGRQGGEVYFTADFLVDLDVTYSIEMTFKDGTVIRIEDYRLPRDWKTHFYYHGTTGTLSPASILRIGEDKRSGLRCHVYAVYPLENYHKLGGSQVQ